MPADSIATTTEMISARVAVAGLLKRRNVGVFLPSEIPAVIATPTARVQTIGERMRVAASRTNTSAIHRSVLLRLVLSAVAAGAAGGGVNDDMVMLLGGDGERPRGGAREFGE
ncbi:hypothetical protein [Microbacterium sp. PA5]|uniref:hypothetical protein n=1 Tax=Microbacterium sp. PA5 TaxID=3416654 RepID=UPI003CEF9D0A